LFQWPFKAARLLETRAAETMFATGQTVGSQAILPASEEEADHPQRRRHRQCDCGEVADGDQFATSQGTRAVRVGSHPVKQTGFGDRFTRIKSVVEYFRILSFESCTDPSIIFAILSVTILA
jgi:hypothetical protein